MKITKSLLKQIIKEEFRSALNESDGKEDLQAFDALMGLPASSQLPTGKIAADGARSANVKQLIEQGRSFFDQVIQLSMNSEDDPDAAQKLNQVEEALSREVNEKSNGYVKFTIIG